MIYQAGNGDICMVVTGDTMLSRRLRPYDEPRFLALRTALGNADVAFTNLEATVRNQDEGVHDTSVGTLMTTPPALLEELKWMGFNMVSCANNHATDFGHQGLLGMIQHLDRAGLVHSGIGANLDQARAPGYLDTRGGRVALISANAFFSPHHRASQQGTLMAGRPGINPLGYSNVYTVDVPAFMQLQKMSRELGFDQEALRRSRHFFSASEIGGGGNDERLVFLGNTFIKGTGFAVDTVVNPADQAGNLKWIREARRQADWVMVSLHCHACSQRDARQAETSGDRIELADFARGFCKAAIDAGADLVVCHGPHISLGVEIYRGKPVFYSLGNFAFQNDTVTEVPRESLQRFGLDADATPADFLDVRTAQETKGFPAHPEFWRSIYAVCRFRHQALHSIEIYPLDLGYRCSRAQRGRPVVAQGTVAAEILRRTAGLSAMYGTRLEIKNDMASVML